jgi:hypothetical protein
MINTGSGRSATKYDDGAKQQCQTKLTPHHHLETMATTDGATPEIQINVKGMLSCV